MAGFWGFPQPEVVALMEVVGPAARFPATSVVGWRTLHVARCFGWFSPFSGSFHRPSLLIPIHTHTLCAPQFFLALSSGALLTHSYLSRGLLSQIGGCMVSMMIPALTCIKFRYITGSPASHATSTPTSLSSFLLFHTCTSSVSPSSSSHSPYSLSSFLSTTHRGLLTFS